MNSAETAKAKVAIGVMLAAFPSSQSSIGGQMVEAYIMSVEDLDLASVEAACRAFVKGAVAGRNNAFAPSAPELVEEARRQQDRLRWEAHCASHDFVVEGSDAWLQITALRGTTPPVREINGVRGWDVAKTEIAEARMIELPKPMAVALPEPQLRRAS